MRIQLLWEDGAKPAWRHMQTSRNEGERGSDGRISVRDISSSCRRTNHNKHTCKHGDTGRHRRGKQDRAAKHNVVWQDTYPRMRSAGEALLLFGGQDTPARRSVAESKAEPSCWYSSCLPWTEANSLHL